MILAPSLSAPGRSDDLAALIAWHAGWTVAAGALAAVVRWRLPDLEGPVLFALAAMILPGLAGLLLLRRDSWGDRALVLGLWSLAATSASALSGGVTGPLAAMAFMPLIAGVALGGPALAQAGAGAVALAALVGLGSVWLSGPGGVSPILGGASAVLAAAWALLAFRLSTAPQGRRLQAAEAGLERIEFLLARQPALTLVMEPSGAVLAAYGTPPPAVAVDPLFGQGLIAAVHAPDRPMVVAALDRALAGQDSQVIFTPHAALDRRVTLIVRAVNTPGDDGARRLIAQAFDGTTQFAREAQLETARSEAAAQSAGKTRFLANMSHELRTPLNAVIGFSDIMRQRLFGPLPDRYGDYADSIHEAGGHLLDLINDVLDVSKIEAERYELALEPFDAREVVSAAIALVRLSANDKGVELTAMLPSEPMPVDADRRALKQMALNLLSNAIKFTPSEGSVTVTLDAIGPYLEIVVADTGVGIAPEDLARLGRPFEQAGASEQRAQGTGLGLSLVRSLAELHGGRMSIDSTLGEGAAITVRLPVVSLPASSQPVGGQSVGNQSVGNLARPAPLQGGAEIIPFRAAETESA